MSNKKSPGSDGLTKEFYLTFWEDLKEDLCEMMNNTYLKEELCESQKEAIVKLIYKKGCPRELKNWRPISLLNIDYKILSKILANRLKTLMPQLVGKDQYCGVPNRSISTANSILTNIWDIECKYRRSKLMYLLIDQKKAFDRVNHEYLFGTLKALNLPENFITWVKLMYRDVYSYIEINGKLTKKIHIKRSVRQGCPLSMLLFVITAEGLAQMIKTNNNIKGYKITPNQEKKLVAYADDTTLILTEPNSLQEAFKQITNYCSTSGAELNQEKTEIIIMGPWKIRDLREVLSLVKDEVTILGIKYCAENMGKLNYTPIVTEIRGKMEIWGKRAHNMMGRSHLLNIYAFPKLLYRMRHIEIPKEIKKQLTVEMFKFIWQQDIQTIGQQKIARPRNLGGTGLFDLDTRQQALWLQETNEIVVEPNAEVNLLRRAILGPIPNLSKYFRENKIQIKHVNMTEISSNKTKYIRKNLGNKIPMENKVRIIYENMHEERAPIGFNELEQFSHLNQIKHAKLWQYGYLTAHRGHKTRHWLYSKNFSIKDVQKSKGQCTKCKQNETQEHILQSCLKTNALRKHIKQKYKISNPTKLTGNRETDIRMLAYQKTALTYTIHTNKGNPEREDARQIEDYESLLEQITLDSPQ